MIKISDNDAIVGMILGGIFGAAISSPKIEDTKELQEYRAIKQEIALRQQKLGIVPDFNKFRNKSEYYPAFIEAYKLYLQGFYRGSTIISSVLLESILRDKFGDKRFYDLIEDTSKSGFISKMESYFLHGIREERNESVHNVLREVTEEDCNITLRLTIKLLEKIIQVPKIN